MLGRFERKKVKPKLVSVARKQGHREGAGDQERNVLRGQHGIPW